MVLLSQSLQFFGEPYFAIIIWSSTPTPIALSSPPLYCPCLLFLPPTLLRRTPQTSAACLFKSVLSRSPLNDCLLAAVGCGQPASPLSLSFSGLTITLFALCFFFPPIGREPFSRAATGCSVPAFFFEAPDSIELALASGAPPFCLKNYRNLRYPPRLPYLTLTICSVRGCSPIPMLLFPVLYLAPCFHCDASRLPFLTYGFFPSCSRTNTFCFSCSPHPGGQPDLFPSLGWSSVFSHRFALLSFTPVAPFLIPN